MKLFLSIVLLLISNFLWGQDNSVQVYLFPGQASDYRIFQKLEFPTQYKPVYLTYPEPRMSYSLQEYAYTLIPMIDTTRPYVFIGQSLGGMLCTELADTLSPEKVILISSAKCRSELPVHYKFQRYVPVNLLVPRHLMKASTYIVQPLFEPDRNSEKETFKAMISDKTPWYYKWSINMIIHWSRTTYSPEIIHIHGGRDNTLPLKNIECDYVIPGGSHLMVLTNAGPINRLLSEIL